MSEAVVREAGLDPTKFRDVDLSSDYVVQNMQNGLAVEWATSEPFFIVHVGIVQVVACRHKDVWEIFQDRDRFSSVVPKRPGVETMDPFNGVEAKVIEFEDVGAAGLVHRMRVQNVSGRFR